MNKYHLSLIVSILLLATACINEETSVPVDPQEEKIPILLNIQSVNGMQNSSRALISGIENLQTACTSETDGGEGQEIAIWGDCILGSGAEQVLQKDIFKGTSLFYKDITSGNPHSYWNYSDGIERYWSRGGFYKFRAYYPKAGTEVFASSNASTFVINYNTATQQDDLLVAYNEVDASNPATDLTQPVHLKLRHALAAIKFKFRFEQGYADSDQLTSCWLENTVNDTEGFYNLGLLIFGNETNSDDISWSASYRPIIGEKMFYWESDGLPIESSETETTQCPTAYTTPDGYITKEGTNYTNNDGFLLILPQTSKGKTKLCFTTAASNKNIPYSITIPTKTGTSLQTWLENNYANAKNSEGEDFVPGYRYTYTIVITKTNCYMTLSIAPWDRYESSHSITFD